MLVGEDDEQPDTSFVLYNPAMLAYGRSVLHTLIVTACETALIISGTAPGVPG